MVLWYTVIPSSGYFICTYIHALMNVHTFIIYFMCLHVYVCGSVCVPGTMRGGQRTNYMNQFCPSTMWGLGIKSRSSDMATGTSATPPSCRPTSFFPCELFSLWLGQPVTNSQKLGAFLLSGEANRNSSAMYGRPVARTSEIGCVFGCGGRVPVNRYVTFGTLTSSPHRLSFFLFSNLPSSMYERWPVQLKGQMSMPSKFHRKALPDPRPWCQWA